MNKKPPTINIYTKYFNYGTTMNKKPSTINIYTKYYNIEHVNFDSVFDIELSPNYGNEALSDDKEDATNEACKTFKEMINN